MQGHDDQSWREDLARHILSSPRPLEIVGVGNPLRRDDGVGIVVAGRLAREFPRGNHGQILVRVAPLTPERTLSRVPPNHGLLILDAVETGAEPGALVCATLNDTNYSFFATHNIPLRLIPALADRLDKVYIAGVAPESVEFGEGLTDRVSAAADILASELSRLVGEPG